MAVKYTDEYNEKHCTENMWSYGNTTAEICKSIFSQIQTWWINDQVLDNDIIDLESPLGGNMIRK